MNFFPFMLKNIYNASFKIEELVTLLQNHQNYTVYVTLHVYVICS